MSVPFGQIFRTEFNIEQCNLLMRKPNLYSSFFPIKTNDMFPLPSKIQPFHLCSGPHYLLTFLRNLYLSLSCIINFSPNGSVVSAYKPPLISPVTEVTFCYTDYPFLFFLKEFTIWLLFLSLLKLFSLVYLVY